MAKKINKKSASKSSQLRASAAPLCFIQTVVNHSYHNLFFYYSNSVFWPRWRCFHLRHALLDVLRSPPPALIYVARVATPQKHLRNLTSGWIYFSFFKGQKNWDVWSNSNKSRGQIPCEVKLQTLEQAALL